MAGYGLRPNPPYGASFFARVLHLHIFASTKIDTMPYIHPSALEYERRRWLRPNAHLFIRSDWRRFVQRGSELEAYYESIERKYNANQPRVPRGNPDGGQWTSGEGGGGNADNGSHSSDRNPNEPNSQLAQFLPWLVRPLPFLSKPPIVPRPLIRPPLEEWPTNPTESPPGYVWRGQPGSTPGDGRGSYVKPKAPGALEDETLRYDNSPGHKPHWDYRAPDGNLYRWYPDGTMEPKIILLDLVV
jgi:hypothetical protein